MKKKWITKSEIAKILETYSVRKDEFQPVRSQGYFFQSRIIKGYTISISQEQIRSKDISEATGRILVSHSQPDGRKTFDDIWQRDPGGTLYFRFRNLWDQPFSDADYIKELEEKNQQLLIAGKKFQEELAVSHSDMPVPESGSELSEAVHGTAVPGTAGGTLKPAAVRGTEKQEMIHDAVESHKLIYEINLLKAENERLKNKMKHNARGAGRKPSQERLNAVSQVKSLLDSGCNDQDIIDGLGISRATFYRYKKSIKNYQGNS